MKNCAGCSFVNDENSRFCGRCGAPLSICREAGFTAGDRYRIDVLIEGGTGGWVYRGTDLQMQRPVRIREITPHPEAPFAPADRIVKGAAPFYSLPGGYSVSLSDIYFGEESIFIIYESIPGRPLNPGEYEDIESPAFITQSIRRLIQAFNILDNIHEGPSPAICGTIRPSSFQTDDAGGLVLADPGFSFVLRSPGDLPRYCRPGYLAPEAFTLGTLNPKSDYFSVGAVFHHLLTGRNPEYKKGDPFRFAGARRLNPAIPPELNQVLELMLKEDYRSRGKNPARFIRKLRMALREPGPGDQHITRGIAFYNRGKYDEAAIEFERAGLMDPEDPVAFFWRGLTYKAAGDRKKAMIYFNRTLELDSEYQSAYCQRGNVKTEGDDYAGALEDFTRAITLDEKDSRAYMGRGMAKRHMGQPESAMDDLKTAVKLDPAYALAHLWLGLITFEMGRISEALGHYDKAVESDPEDPYSFVARGTARAEGGDFKGALQDLDTAVSLHDRYDSAYMERGLVYFRMENNEQALLDLDRCISLDPHNTEAYFHRGRIRYKTGDYPGAIEDLSRFIDEVPDDPEAYRLRGQAFRCVGNFDRGNRDTRIFRSLKNPENTKK